MKHTNAALVCLLMMGIASTSLFAQSREVIVEPTGLNALTALVESEFNTLGAEVVSDTKYILRRGATYPYSENFNGPVNIYVAAEEGEGPRPIILAVNTGSEAPRMFRPQDADSLSLTYIGLEYPGFDSDGNHMDNAILRVRGNGGRQHAEDLVLDGHRLEISRMDGLNQTFRFVNNIVRNNYQTNKWDKGWGIVNLREQPQDSVIISGNTFFNTTTKVIQDGNDTTMVMHIAKNTFANVGARAELSSNDNFYIDTPRTYGAFDMGAAQELIIEDNIFYNVGFMGVPAAWADSFYVFN